MNKWAKRNPEKSAAGIPPTASFLLEADRDDKASNAGEFLYAPVPRTHAQNLAVIASVPGDGRGGARSKEQR